MNPKDQSRFNTLYRQHLDALTLQGKSSKTRQMYGYYLQQVAKFFDACPDHLTAAELKAYFLHLVQTRSWSTVKVARNAIQFFYRFVLGRPWDWIPIVKPPKVQPLQDVLSMAELNRLINQTRKLSYQVYFLTTYSLGLRLSEALTFRSPTSTAT
jgi:integrase/recombinase XerD